MKFFIFSALYTPRSRSRSQEPVSEPEPPKLRSPEPPIMDVSATLRICIIGSRHDPIPHGVAHHDPGCLFETIRTSQTTQHRRTIIALTKMSICLRRYALCMHDIDPHNEYEFGKQQSNYTFAKLFKTTICKDDKSFFN